MRLFRSFPCMRAYQCIYNEYLLFIKNLQFCLFFGIILLMKYKIGDKVIHFRNGVSTIVATTVMGDRDYFVVRSLRGDGENIYVPVLNSDSVIRNILTASEADSLLKDLANVEKEFNPNTKQRRDAYKRRLSSGKVEDIAYLFRQNLLYAKYPENVKLGPSDIDMLQYATNIFLDELSLTYKVDREKVEELAIKKIK